MTRSDMETAIRNALTRLTEHDAHDLSLDADLAASLGLDSLGRLELLSEMEERFEVTIFDVDSESASTIRGMLSVVETALADQKETA